jgi:predicted MFS family arabinose efflux permease
MRFGMLRDNQSYRRLWLAAGTSDIGSLTSYVALPLLTLSITRSAADTGLVGLIGALGMMASALPGGVVVDRFDRRRIMLICDAGRTVAAAVLGTSIVFERVSYPLIIAVAAITGLLSGPFSPAANAVIRQVVPSDHLGEAIALQQARGATTAVLGPILGGLLFQVAHAAPFILDAMSYAASFLMVALIRAEPGAFIAKNGNREQLFWRDLSEGIGFLFRNQFLRFVLALGAVLSLVFPGVILALIVVNSSSGGPPLATGVIIGASGVGSVVGSLLAPSAMAKLSNRAMVLIVCLSTGLLVPVLGFTHSPIVMSLVVAACATVGPGFNVALGTACLRATPDHLLGRVQSADSLFITAVGAMAPAAAGLALTAVSPRVLFVGYGVALLLAGVATALTSAFAVYAASSESSAKAESVA